MMHKPSKKLIRKAQKAANKRKECLYIVWDEGKYEVCTLFDLDTFFCGCPVELEIFPGD